MSRLEPRLEKVQQSFRRSLRTYDDSAYVQLEIAQTLIKILNERIEQQAQKGQKIDFEHVFEIGCGTGFLTKLLLENFEIGHLVLNDLVSECEPVIESLLSQMQQENKGKKSSTWEFIAGDIKTCEIEHTYSLICSASTLQWVDDMEALLNKFYDKLPGNGWLALTSFGPNHFFELRKLTQQNDESRNKQTDIKSQQLLNYLSEKSWLDLLGDRFSVEDIQTHSITLWFDSFDELLRHLRNTGVNGNTRRQWSQRMKKNFATQYESMFAQAGKLPLTYEPVYIVANKV